MEEKDHFIYVLLKNGVVKYVGITKDFVRRIREHRLDDRKDFDEWRVLDYVRKKVAVVVETQLILKYETEVEYGGWNRVLTGKTEYLQNLWRMADCEVCEKLGCAMDEEELVRVREVLGSKGFEYLEGLVKDRGFKSYNSYQDVLVRDRGFDGLRDYDRVMLRKRGFGTYGGYQDMLARKKGFGSDYDRRNSWAVGRGFSGWSEYGRFVGIVRMGLVCGCLMNYRRRKRWWSGRSSVLFINQEKSVSALVLVSF